MNRVRPTPAITGFALLFNAALIFAQQLSPSTSPVSPPSTTAPGGMFGGQVGSVTQGVPHWVVVKGGEVDQAERKGGNQVVVFLSGVSGYRGLEQGFTRGLAATFTGRVEVYDWTAYNPGLGALLGYERNRREALVVARRIEQWVKEGRDVSLIAHSGGCGLAVWALEALPDGVTVRQVVLMAPALSPSYDLRPAMGRVTGRIFALTSPHDPVLGTLTRTFGTIDRVRSDSAGLRGFTRPAGVKETEYQKLSPLEYHEDWAKYGHPGDHIGYLETPFATSVVVPLLVK